MDKVTPGRSVALLTTRAACTFLSVSASSLYRFARAGKLEPVHLTARMTRWRRAELLEIANGDGREAGNA